MLDTENILAAECRVATPQLVASFFGRDAALCVTPSVLISIIHAPRCGATVCRTHLRLDDWGFHCDGNYVYAQILGACIIS